MIVDLVDRYMFALSALQISHQRISVFRFIMHSGFRGHLLPLSFYYQKIFLLSAVPGRLWTGVTTIPFADISQLGETPLRVLRAGTASVLQFLIFENDSHFPGHCIISQPQALSSCCFFFSDSCCFFFSDMSVHFFKHVVLFFSDKHNLFRGLIRRYPLHRTAFSARWKISVLTNGGLPLQ